MQSQSGVSRVVVVVLDGLRPDAIGSFRLTAMAELMAGGAWTLDATTVSPSVTVAAITSLLTGVSPDTHGLKGDRVFITLLKVAQVPALPACEAVHAKGMAQARADARKTDDAPRLEAEAEAAYVRCWNEHAREASAYPAILLQAQRLADAFASD